MLIVPMRFSGMEQDGWNQVGRRDERWWSNGEIGENRFSHWKEKDVKN